MTTHTPTIIKLCERLLVEIETVVRGFARYNKYSVGADLRTQARAVTRLSKRAWFDKPRTAQWVRALVGAVDDLKTELQTAKELRAFRSFAQFEMLARLVAELGKQCGGWHKDQHERSQNAEAINPPLQRAQRLSARAASSEAHL